MFLDLIFHCRYGVIHWTKPGHRAPCFIHNKLGEVPFDSIDEEAALLLLQEVPERVCVTSVDVDFGKHVECDVVFGNKLLNI